MAEDSILIFAGKKFYHDFSSSSKSDRKMSDIFRFDFNSISLNFVEIQLTNNCNPLKSYH